MIIKCLQYTSLTLLWNLKPTPHRRTIILYMKLQFQIIKYLHGEHIFLHLSCVPTHTELLYSVTVNDYNINFAVILEHLRRHRHRHQHHHHYHPWPWRDDECSRAKWNSRFLGKIWISKFSSNLTNSNGTDWICISHTFAAKAAAAAVQFDSMAHPLGITAFNKNQSF